MANRTYQRGTCAICGHEVNARHYFRAHSIRLRDYFTARGGAGAPGSYTYYCRKDREGVSGLHEGMAHLVAKHRELLPQQPQSQDSRPAPTYNPSDATVGGVFHFLVEKRKEAEDDAACLRVSISTLEVKLKDAEERISRLAQANQELTNDNRDLHTQNSALREENKRVISDNRSMNKELLRFRNGAISTADLRETYRESVGKR